MPRIGSTSSAPTSSATPARLAAAALVLALAFLALAGARPLNVPDEGRYAEVAREMVVTGDLVTPRLDFVPFLDKPPLFPWLVGAGLRLFGATPFGARFASALLGALGCLFVLGAGARLSGWRAGLLGAAALAAMPLWYGGAQYVNHDLPVAVWITGATLSLALAFPAAGRARPGWLLLAGLAAGLALLTKGLIGVVFPFGSAGLWLLMTGRWRQVLWLIAPFLLALGVAAPWVLACQAANPDFLHYFFVTQHFERFTGRGFNNPMGPAFYFLVVPVALLPWTASLPAALARGWRAWRSDRSDPGADLLLLLWPALVLGFFSIPASKIVGYALPAIPPLALLVGRWWAGVPEGAYAPRPWLAAAAGGSLGILGAGALVAPWLSADDRALDPVPGWATATLTVTGLLLLGGGVVVAQALRGGALRRAFAAQVASVGVLLTGLSLAAQALLPQGTDRLADRIRALRREGDTVVAWRHYYYDLTFLLDDRAPVVVAERWDDPAIARQDSWRRELLLGRTWQPGGSGWLQLPDEVERRCGGPARCFVVAPAPEVEALRARLPLVPLQTQGRAVLLATPAAAVARVAAP